eukprot:m.172287 g.172287  ORF g.172287 m.172287 type:complete len:352 (-) comp31677_c0_seq2:78-1133(-)
MAGLDTRRATDFIGMLQGLGTHGSAPSSTLISLDPIQVCTDTIKATQMASDSLLLRERDTPLSKQPYSGCYDTVVTKKKEMALAIAALQTGLNSNQNNELCRQLAIVTETMCLITETTAQAVFMMAEKTPGGTKSVSSMVDAYVINRGKLAIEVAANATNKEGVTKEQVMATAAVFATHLELIREQCLSASAKLSAKHANDAKQYDAIARALSGNSSMLLTALKTFVADPSHQNQSVIFTFTKPVLSVVEALLEYGTMDKFIGRPPSMKPKVADHAKEMQACALSAVSGTTLMVASVKVVLTNPTDVDSRTQIARYATSINGALESLSNAMKTARDAKLMFEDPAKSTRAK